MKFFNRKEEVIDFQLTQYGKHLFSKGRLEPVFYAFFDDDIIYDNEYTTVPEHQNAANSRIKETPRLKTQYSFQGSEKNVLETKRHIDRLRSENWKNFIEGPALESSLAVQPTIEQHYAMALPIGTAGPGNKYVPAWEVTSYNSFISSSVSHEFLFGGSQTDQGKPTFKIPQININVEYQTIATRGGDYKKFIRFEDDTILAIEEDYVLLEILEENGLSSNEEFEAEVFNIEGQYTTLTSATMAGHVLGDVFFNEIAMHRLTFEKLDAFKKYTIDKNNMLVQNNDVSVLAEGEETLSSIRGLADAPILYPTMTEYFFDISLDKEIDPVVLCGHKPIDRTKGLYTNPIYRCKEVMMGTPQRLNIYSNLEDTGDPFSPPPDGAARRDIGEPCE